MNNKNKSHVCTWYSSWENIRTLSQRWVRWNVPYGIARWPERVVGGFVPWRHHHRIPQAFNRNCCLDGLGYCPWTRRHDHRSFTSAICSFANLFRGFVFFQRGARHSYEKGIFTKILCILANRFAWQFLRPLISSEHQLSVKGISCMCLD